ncbi:MAG: M20/M25/M40 family metallo-hydrolase [SAR202 cluster bacterium]|nr:M20/M25/M40 family metallo-hydrolase [SAR202 cluster bacterium]
MTDPKQQALDFLSRLGSNPATAFNENGVADTVRTILGELGIEHRQDEFGNIIAKVSGTDATTNPLAIVAHMDHPGFEITAHHEDGSSKSYIATAMGGVPPSSFEAGVPILALLPDGSRAKGVTGGKYGEASERQILIRLEQPQDLEPPLSVVFDLVDFELDGEHIRMRAVDDLAGCGSILAALARLTAGEAPPGDVYGVFTRAEEVGLVGARLMAEAGTLPPETLVISAESSRTLPGAEMGEGIVIRVGDAGFTFTADAEAVLIRAREVLRERDSGFKCQRQLMSGGTCEASAFAVYGYQTTGIAFPLGNYHNGAPEDRIEAEYIHIDDYLGGVELITEAALRVSDRTNTAFRQRLREVPDDMRQRMLDTGR